MRGFPPLLAGRCGQDRHPRECCPEHVTQRLSGAANLTTLDELGGTKTYNHYPNGWAMAFITPFKMWKRYEFNGGTADPCIIS
jgi:arylsulfatase A-like enzyme